jgi:hypothetical protein
LQETLWWSFPGAAKKNRTRPRPEKKNWNVRMKFTGTLIEDLMKTVERAERTAQSNRALPGESLTAESLVVEPLFAGTWFASVQEPRDYDPNLIGVA